MENNKAYLKQFGIVSLIMALSTVLFIWLSEQLTKGGYDNVTFLIVFQVLPLLLVMISMGIITQKWNAVLSGIVVYALAEALQYFLLEKNKNSSVGQGTRLLIHIVISMLPLFIFFLVAKTESRKIPGVFLGVLLLMGTNGLYMAEEGFTWLTELFRKEWHVPKYILSFLTMFTAQMVHVILLCELTNYAAGKNKGFQARIINPGNEYDKGSATIVYWVLKTFLYLSILGCLAILRSYTEFFSDYYRSSLGFLKWYYFVSLLATGLLMITAAWYLRKFLLEYFISYNHTSRFLYWVLLLPFIGFFAWLVMLTDSSKQTTFKERKKTLEDLASSSREGVITILGILLGLRFLILIVNGQTGAILTLLIAVVLFISLISSVSGYYFNLYLNFLLLVVFLFLPVFKANINIGAILFPFLLLNSIQLILIFPALHFEAFDYMSYEEEKPWQPGDDLF